MAAERSLKASSFDISHCRADFPLLKQTMHGRRLAFLDTAASAQKPRAVIDAMSCVAETGYSNIHRGLYAISQNLTRDFEAARARIGQFINAPANSIVFTRNATEAINLVAQSWGSTFLKQGDEIILSEMEHHANIVPWQLLREKNGIEIKVIPVSEDGSLDLDSYRNLLSTRTKLVAVTHISNAIGTINPVKQIIDLAKNFNPNIKVLIDGSQGVVHSVVNVRDIDCDFYVFTGHKLYGPTGIGVLYGKYETLGAMPPYQGGGDMIERVTFKKTTFKEPPARFEAGTPAIIEVIGLAAAIDYLSAIGPEAIQSHEQGLLDYMTGQLREIEGLVIHGNAPKKAGIVSFSLAGAHPSDVAVILDKMGVAVRVGHLCCMPLMQKMGVDAVLRASLGLYSDKADIDQLMEGLHKAGEMLR